MSDETLVTPRTYKDYERYGVWSKIEKRVKDRFVLGLTIPFQVSDSYKDNAYFTPGDYKHTIFGDFDLFAGWEIIRNAKYALFSDLHWIIPANSNRASKVDPYIYLGLDGHTGIKLNFSGAFNFTKDFSLNTSVSYLNTLPKTQVLIGGQRAIDLTGSSDSIVGEFNPRDVLNYMIKLNYKWSNSVGTFIGFERWFETTDTISNLQNIGNAEMATLNAILEGPEGYLNYMFFGFKFPFIFESSIDILYKYPLSGSYAYNENIWAIAVQKDI